MPAVILSPVKDWRLALAALLQQRGVQCMASDDVIEAVAAARGVGGAVIVAHAQCGGDDLRVLLRSAARSEGSPVAIAGPWPASEPALENLITARFEQAFSFLDIVGWVQELVPASELYVAPVAESGRALTASGSFLLTFDGSDTLAGPTPDEDARLQWESALPALDVDALLRIGRHENDHMFLGFADAPVSADSIDRRQHALDRTLDAWFEQTEPESPIRGTLEQLRAMVADSCDSLRWALAARAGG